MSASTIQCNSMLYKTTISSAVAPSVSAAGSVVRDLGVTVDYIRYGSHLQRVGYYEQTFLPPANEVLGKVMFSEVSVILSTGGGVSV